MEEMVPEQKCVLLTAGIALNFVFGTQQAAAAEKELPITVKKVVNNRYCQLVRT